MLYLIFSNIFLHIIIQLVGDDDSISDTTGNDSDMLLKCHSTDHKVSCWNLSLIHVSNEDCNVNNSFGIISTFSRSLYPNIELEKNILTLLETLDDVYNLDESENSCMKVTVSFLPHLDIASSATPGEICHTLAIVAKIVYMGKMGVLDGKGQI